MRLPEISPAANAVIGAASLLLGIMHLFSNHSVIYYHHPTMLSGVFFTILGVILLIPFIKQKFKKR
jgi:hypothetical protein